MFDDLHLAARRGEAEIAKRGGKQVNALEEGKEGEAKKLNLIGQVRILKMGLEEIKMCPTPGTIMP